MPNKFKKTLGRLCRGMSVKLSIAFFSIVAILIVSAIISIVEFRVMSTYVSDSISENIRDINLSTEVSVALDRYNSTILTLVGNADSLKSPDVDLRSFGPPVISEIESFVARDIPCADSLKSCCETFLATSYQLDSVLANDFVDTRNWYFTVLQPAYNDLRSWQDKLNTAIYDNLHENSVDFDESFYRGIMPGVVSVGAAVLLLLLLLFFIRVYYVRPLNKMISGLDAYKHSGQVYNNVFEGDDQIQELNCAIGDLLDENLNLKRRMRSRES